MMKDNDFVAPASATGILHCLKLLASEAASLNLVRTLSAIEDALDMAACESGMDNPLDGNDRCSARPILH